jgi:hypothetical protein
MKMMSNFIDVTYQIMMTRLKKHFGTKMLIPIHVYKGALNLAFDFFLSKAKNVGLAALGQGLLTHEKGESIKGYASLYRTIGIRTFLCIGLMTLSFTLTASEKHGLIIAIGQYDKATTGWGPISSKNDIPLIRQMLNNQGFIDNNIATLIDAQATKSGIEAALAQLVKKINKGDIVVIHYSGHGQQILDNNGDEIDGLDETIVAYGAPARGKYYKGGKERYDGSLHLRDDDFGKHVMAIRQKLGDKGHLLVIMDSCHSGTGTRGSNTVRGGEPPFLYEKLDNKNTETGGMGFQEEKSATRGDDSNLSKYVLFSGASAHELNFETDDGQGNSVGSLSYSVSKVFSALNGTESYRSIFNKIRGEMASVAPKQSPALEGDIDFKLFKGETVEQEPFFEIKEITNDQEIYINGGTFAGLYEGTILSVYPAGTIKAEGEPMAIGTVMSPDYFETKVKLNKSINIKKSAEAVLFVKEYSFGDKKILVNVDSIDDKDLTLLIKSKLTELGMVEVVSSKDADLHFRDARASRGSSIAVEIVNTRYNSLLHNSEATDETKLAEQAFDIIKNYAQGTLIKEMDFHDSNYQIELELIPVLARKNADGSVEITKELDPEDYKDDAGYPVFPTTIQALLKVKNVGQRRAYFNIIDLQPDGFMNPVLPTTDDVDGKEYFLLPKQEVILPNLFINVGPPYGNEIFKVITSSDPLNLTPTIQVRGATTRGLGNPFEKALGDSFDGTKTRGTTTVSNEGSKTSTYEYGFKIADPDVWKPKKSE